MRNLSAVIAVLLVSLAGLALADNTDPPESVLQNIDLAHEVCGIIDLQASDIPNDEGGSVELTWIMESEGIRPDSLGIMRRDPAGSDELIATLPADFTEYSDDSARNGTTYSYWILSLLGGVAEACSDEVQAVASAQWLYSSRIGMLVILTLIMLVIIYYIESGKRGKELYIREIGGLAAVDDAVGRATEMGRPVLYVPGIMDMDNIQTIASIVILGRVARKTAEYGSPLLVPTSRSVVMSVAQEVVKEGYLQAGRSDAYNKENIQYLTDDQFGYAAGVDGIMVREKPAAIFLLGCFYAESLILAETGRSVGAIQIAGTAMPSQIPFFIAACDYTLIGEELFAASAYLSREPKLLGSLKGQDAGKLFFLILIVVGVIAASIGDFWSPMKSVAEFLRKLVTVN